MNSHLSPSGTTLDGGASWLPQSSGTTSSLVAISFVGATGTAVGDGGTILRTTDGGSSWSPQSSGTFDSLFGVSFTDADTGSAVGDDGTILSTSDGASKPHDARGRIWC